VNDVHVNDDMVMPSAVAAAVAGADDNDWSLCQRL